MRPPTDTEMQAVMKSLNEARNHLDLLTFDAPQEFRKALYPLHDCIEGLEMAQKGETCMTLETYPQRYVDALNAEIAMLRDKLAGYEIPHDKREPRCQAVGSDAEGKVPTTALTEHRVSREAIRPPGSGADELEYWRDNAMHYHGLCVALEDEIDMWELALEGKNAAIRRSTEWLEKANEQAELYKGHFDEMQRFESIRNGDLVTALEACMEALSQADDSGVVIPLLEDAMKRAEHARSGTCYKCGGCRMKPLPKFADACNCEGGGGGGFVDLPPAEEKYNA